MTLNPAAIASLVLLAGCAAATGTPSPVEIVPVARGDVEAVRGGPTRLRVGQAMTVALSSNSTTGYLWQASGIDGGVLTPGTPFGEAFTDPHAPGMVGVGGVTRWRFVASRPGVVTVTFTHGRSWERDTPPAETQTYRVVVR